MRYGGFPVTWVPKLLLPPVKIRIFGPKRPNLVKNMYSWSFWAKYWHFWPILSHARPKTMQNRCLGVFSVMWVPKLLLSPIRIRIFCPKMTKFGPKLAFWVILGQALLAHLVPCCWVGWWLWRAGFISQDTYLIYSLLTKSLIFFKNSFLNGFNCISTFFIVFWNSCTIAAVRERDSLRNMFIIKQST